MTKKLFLILILFSTVLSASNVSKLLVNHGFNNVRFAKKANTAIVSYENTVYRNNLQAVKYVFNAVFNNTDCKNAVIIPCYKGTFICEISISKKDFDSNGEKLNIKHNNLKYVDCIRNKPVANPDRFNFDIIGNLRIKAKFGAYANPIQDQINIVPEVETSFWKGMTAYTSLVIPIRNEFSKHEDKIRPGEFGINQSFKLLNGLWLNSTVGKFTQNRYGFDGQAFAFISKLNMFADLTVGYTGYAEYFNNEWKYENVDLFTYFAKIGYFEQNFDLHFSAGYGKFLAEDKGFRVDLSRRFGEFEFGFFAVFTDEDNNSGINFSIPLFTKKHMTKKTVRLRLANSFSWEYRALGIPNFGIQYLNRKRIDKLVKTYIY